MAFSDDAIAFIDELVDKLKKEGVTGTNRSSVIRNIISEFNKMYEDESNVFTSPSDLKPNTFHVEKETHGFLTKWTKTRSLNYSIEQLILDPDFPKLTEDDISYLNFTPSNLVPIRISISAKAYAVFDDIIKNLGLGITRAAIMRLAVRKLIEIDKGIPLTELIAKKILVRQFITMRILPAQNRPMN